MESRGRKSSTWSQSSPMIFYCLDYWLISNNLYDPVKTTDIIPSIKTDHAAISLELVNDSNEIKGPVLWPITAIRFFPLFSRKLKTKRKKKDNLKEILNQISFKIETK